MTNDTGITSNTERGHSPNTSKPTDNEATNNDQNEAIDTSTPPQQDKKGGKSGKRKRMVLTTVVTVSLVISLVAVLSALYAYQNAQRQNEMNAYSNALDSDEPAVLKNFLDIYTDAPQAHRDSVAAMLYRLQMLDREWDNAVANGTKQALERYIQLHPTSIHNIEAKILIDSIDWAAASSENTSEAYLAYMEAHPDGLYIDEAQSKYARLDSKKVKAGERQHVGNLLTAFFASLGANDENGIAECLANKLDTFNTEVNATKSTVAAYMKRLHNEDDITTMTFTPNNDWMIDKQENADGLSEYNATFSVDKRTERTDPTKSSLETYRVAARIDGQGKIASLRMEHVTK